MIRSLILASSNLGKIREIQALFAGSGVEIISPTKKIDVEETGVTFAENACLKAQAYGEEFQQPAIADDSGLEVLSLDYEPGVRSARWAPGSDLDRNAALLEKLDGETDRRAQFVCVVCIFDPTSQQEWYFEGRVTGTISDSSRGENGFGYDPIFIPEGHDQTFAELGDKVKNSLSHRARAFSAARAHLEKS